MAQYYQKRVETVTAEQFTGTNQADMVALSPEFIKVEGTNLLFDMNAGGGLWVGVNVGEWLYVNESGVVSISNETFTKFWVAGMNLVVAARYEARPISAVEAIVWNGTNFVGVQAVCPQAVKNGSVLSIPVLGGVIEVYVGDVVMRYLDSGNCTKLKSEAFEIFYEVSGL